MILVLFDLGGTLINDPFPDTMIRLRESTKPQHVGLNDLSEFAFDKLLGAWGEENASFNFPLASHFLQEEVWIIRAFRAIATTYAVHPGNLPVIAARLLELYRVHAKEVVASQLQLPHVREALELLLKHDVQIGVASNDRDFATRSMLSWAQLDSYFRWIFTSEGLSTPEQQIEKPQELFFSKIEQAIIATDGAIGKRIYVGDNELNDVEIPRRLGYLTVRYINKTNPANAVWLDHRTTTSASYQYTDPQKLPALVETILTDLL
jgi:FMN phosphatase YigB (HAD superfamily)